MLERARVDLHAAKWASAARMASDRLMSFFAAAAFRASNAAAIPRPTLSPKRRRKAGNATVGLGGLLLCTSPPPEPKQHICANNAPL